MKFQVRFFANNPRQPCDDLEVAAAYEHTFVSDWMVWGTPRARRFLDAFATGPGCQLDVHVGLSWKEAAGISFFELVPRHIVDESDRVNAANLTYAESQPDHHETDFGAFKLRKQVYVEKLKSRPRRIWSLEYCEGYLAEEALVEELVRGFSGIKSGPVIHAKTEERIPGWLCFYADTWLEALEENSTTYHKHDGVFDYIERRLVHSAQPRHLAQMPDMFRFPQTYGCGDSAYAVRREVMEAWFAKGIRRSFFLQPLLVVGSPAYEETMMLWEQVMTALQRNPNNKL